MSDTSGGAWHPDPTGRFEHRWFDGEQWTATVSTAGQSQTDPQWKPATTPAVSAVRPGEATLPVSGLPEGFPGAQPVGPGSQRLNALGGIITATAVVTILASILAVITAFAFARRGAFLSGKNILELFVESDELKRLEDFAGVMFILFNLASLVVFVLMIILTHQATVNANRLVGPLRWSNGWAVGAWFVPVAGAVLPHLVLQQAWRAAVEPHERDRWATTARSGRLLAWWVLWPIGYVLLWIGAIADPDEADEAGINAQRNLDYLAAFGLLLIAVSGVVAVLALRSLRDRHDRRAHERAAGSG